MVYTDWGVFNAPERKPFVETYFTITGKNLAAIKTKNVWQSIIQAEVIIKKDSKEDDFHSRLTKYIDDRYFADIRCFNNLIFHSKTL